MLAVIAWRNIWRNKLRSGIVIAAIALGILGGLFSIAFMEGLADQTLKTAISQQVSHIQLHHPLFLENEELKYRLHNADGILAQLLHRADVAAAARRYRVRAMASTANGSSGIEILGIDPENEKKVTTVYKKLIAGAYFADNRRNPVLVGAKLADKLKVRLGQKIVLTAQSEEGTLTGGAFKIIGIFKTDNSLFDENQIFVDYRDISRLLDLPRNESHEIAVLLKNPQELALATQSLAAQFPDEKVENWREIAPELGMLQGYMQQMMFIFLVIILIALAFGIVNTMLMAVIERTRELGLLMALGMSRKRVFAMIILETVFLSLLGGVIGMALSAVVIQYSNHRGIDLAIVGEGMSAMGYATYIYPRLAIAYFAILTVMVIVTAILSSFFPAHKALKLRPTEAIRVE